jgi:hypothetical protein
MTGFTLGTVPPLISSISSGKLLALSESLKEIVVYAMLEKERASGLESFGPYVTARHQVSPPVKVCWSTDEVPRYFVEGHWQVDA